LTTEPAAPIPAQRAASGGAELLLPVRCLGPIDRLAGWTEALEILLRAQGIVPEQEEGRAGVVVGPVTRDDADDSAGSLAELCGIAAGQHLEFVHRVLRQHRSHAANGAVVAVDTVSEHVIGPGALAGEGHAGRG